MYFCFWKDVGHVEVIYMVKLLSVKHKQHWPKTEQVCSKAIKLHADKAQWPFTFRYLEFDANYVILILRNGII